MGRGGDEGAADLSLRTRARSSLGFVCLDEADDPSDQRLELAVAADQARARRQLAQCGRRIRAFDEAAELGDLRCVLLGERALIGLATPAGAEARLLRIGRGGMECDVLGARGTRAAGRATTADQRGSLVVVAASVLLRGVRAGWE